MNTFLKAVVKEVADLEATGVAIFSKAGLLKLVPLFVKDGEDAVAVFSNASTAKAELQALLTDPAADADLLSYATSVFAGDNAKAQKVIAAASDLLLALVGKGEALASAIKT
jgi:hypothetical protein